MRARGAGERRGLGRSREEGLGQSGGRASEDAVQAGNENVETKAGGNRKSLLNELTVSVQDARN